MTLLRVAAGLALNRAPEHRWRRISVPISAMLFMLAMLAATSIALLVMREDGRDTARTAVLAQAQSETDLFVLVRPDDWRGRSILVAWVEPAAADRDPILPPGVEKLPTAGQTVVSPALDRLAAEHPELAARYPNRMVIGPQGVRSGGELFAYARPPAGRGLGPPAAAIRVEAGRVVGDGPVLRIGRFGSPGAAPGLVRFGEPRSAPLGPILGGLSGVLVIPGILILGIGAAAASELRSRRLGILRALGARTRTITMLSVLEALVLAAPGLFAATVAWAILGPRLSTVPLVGYEVAAGDLGLPWWLAVGALGAGIAVTALVAGLLAAASRRRGASPRPAAERQRLSALRIAPLALAAAAFTLGKSVGGYREADFYLLGMVAAVIGVPAIVPVLLRALGGVLGRARSTSVAIAGRSMQWDPARAARPFIGAAALLFLVLTGTGYVTLSRDTDNEEPNLATGATHAVTVQWQDPKPGDLPLLREAVEGGMVAPFVEGGHDHQHDDGKNHHHTGSPGVLSVGATCAEVAHYVPDTTCDPNSPFSAPSAMQQRLADWLAQAVHGAPGQIRLVPPTDLDEAGSALVVDNAPLEALDERTRNAAITTLPAPYVRSAVTSASRESPLIPWLIGGVVTAVIGLTIACLMSLVDRLLGARNHHRQLVNLGISRRRLTALGAWTFALPYIAVLGMSFLAGSVATALLILPTPMPWTPIGITAAVALAAGLLGTISVALLGANSALKERE
jgi:hypothetical protein